MKVKRKAVNDSGRVNK